jgi:hypothetical protein
MAAGGRLFDRIAVDSAEPLFLLIISIVLRKSVVLTTFRKKLMQSDLRPP